MCVISSCVRRVDETHKRGYAPFMLFVDPARNYAPTIPCNILLFPYYPRVFEKIGEKIKAVRARHRGTDPCCAVRSHVPAFRAVH
jgi:hypothetical protein